MVCYGSVSRDFVSQWRRERRSENMMTVRWNILVAALATAVSLATGAAVVRAQTPGTAQTAPVDRIAGAKASLKSRFGFSDAQATTAVKKAQALSVTYQPKFVALQKKYGPNPTPEQRQKMQREALPMIAEISKKTNTILLSVATKAQRPKIVAQMKAEQEQIAKMQKQ
jgi:hypothetical protein